jgi:hypothetical protein
LIFSKKPPDYLSTTDDVQFNICPVFRTADALFDLKIYFMVALTRTPTTASKFH